MGEQMGLTPIRSKKLHRRFAALFHAGVVSAGFVGCVACPSAHADTIYGTGSYNVPDQLPYGIYIAHGDPGFNPAKPESCTFSTWTSDGKLIKSDGGNQPDTRIAEIQAPAVAKFITHGCTSWIKVG
jgi:hypothetical protein